MAVNLEQLMKLFGKLLMIEKKIRNEIAKERDAKKRKKLNMAYKKRDLETIRDLLFNPDK